MKALVQSSNFFVRRFVGFVAMVLAAAALAPSASAQLTGGTPVVSYTPSTSLMGGQIPYSRFYDLEIKSPSSAASNTPLTVTIQLSVNSKPVSVSDATALSYVSLSTPTLSYTAPNQTRIVRITVTVPLSAEPGSYGYQVMAVGFPTNAQGALVNVGASIDSTITAADVLAPPTVGIVTPADGTEIRAAALPVTIPLSFTAASTGSTATPITSVQADLDNGTTVPLSGSGLGTTSVAAQGSLTINSYGSHTVTVSATNQGGTATDTNAFTVVIDAPPPTVVINTPTAGSTYTYRLGAAATVVPFTFTGRSNIGNVRTLTAKVDNAEVTFTPSGIGTGTATGSINLPYTTAGSHTVSVTVTDDVGSATTSSNFTVTIIAPTPAIDITSPTDDQIFTIPTGQTTVNVPFRFVTTSNNGFVVDSVTASVGTTVITNITTTGLGTATATSTGTMNGLVAGTYTINATGTSAGINVSDAVRFTVRAAAAVPPSVVINTPSPNATFTRVNGAPALQIPLTFTGTSNTTGGVITQLKASLGSTTLTVTPTNLNQKVATGNAIMTVSNAGTYTITVTAIDAYGVANATSKFTVCVIQGKSICGRVFFDANFNGVFDLGCDDDDDYSRTCRDTREWDNCRGSRYDSYYDRGSCRDGGDRYYSRDYNDDDGDDFGLKSVTLKLLNASNRSVVATIVSGTDGSYCFTNIAPGNYIVQAVAPSGMEATTQIERAITVSSKNVAVRDIGFGLDFDKIRTYCANGKNSSFWKTQIDKAISGDKRDVQVSSTNCNTYTRNISALCLSVFDGLTLKNASTYLGTKSTASNKDLLNKELCAAQYNYSHGIYINGDKNLTYCFLQWGERVSKNSSKYTDSYRRYAKGWFEAFNNSNGGRCYGPSN